VPLVLARSCPVGEAERDPAEPLGDDARSALHDGGEVRQHHLALPAAVAALPMHVEGDIADDIFAAVVASAAHVRDLRDHVERRGRPAVGGVEQSDVAGCAGMPTAGQADLTVRTPAVDSSPSRLQPSKASETSAATATLGLITKVDPQT
jgi:hypothetical protein